VRLNFITKEMPRPQVGRYPVVGGKQALRSTELQQLHLVVWRSRGASVPGSSDLFPCQHP
jgi:hypothetical protein